MVFQQTVAILQQWHRGFCYCAFDGRDPPPLEVRIFYLTTVDGSEIPNNHCLDV